MKKEKNNVQKTLAIISQCQSQDEAMERLKAHFGKKPVKMNMGCWFAFHNLPAGNNPSKNKKEL